MYRLLFKVAYCPVFHMAYLLHLIIWLLMESQKQSTIVFKLIMDALKVKAI